MLKPAAGWRQSQQHESELAPMSQGLDNLKHIVVLMMENRSFDHMLGSPALKKTNPGINGPTGNEANPDTAGNTVTRQANATFQAHFQHYPHHHLPASLLQIPPSHPNPHHAPNIHPSTNN